MASSSLRRTWRYNVFTSFHGPDVRETLLSHLRKQFENNAITMFNDENIKRGEVIAPALIKAIEESRISIVLLSKQYASSRWCLDELLEIIKCREEIGQEVRTVFYGVEPSDVRNQDGEFGDAFNKTCAKNPEKREKWRKGLTEVGNIAGEVFKNWKNEAKMIEKIASDISDILLDTAPKYFDGMVGLEAHMREMESRLEFDNKGVVKIVAISGPAGIGKTTIARAIYSRHSKFFHHDCFLKLRELSDCDEYALRGQLLSKVLNLNGIKECHSGLIPERLHDQKVFIILDDVHHLNQLKVLANIRSYGLGSRIIVTTEDKGILQQCGINDIYHVDFPSKEDAQAIFCLSAFGKTSPPDEFMYLADVVIGICGNLPLGLKVVGSSLSGKSFDDWILELPSLKDSLDKGIESVLELGYKSLKEKEQLIFLCIAVLFNGEDGDYVTSMLDERKLNAKCGLRILANRNLIQKVGGRVEMHPLLQVMAMQVISKEDVSKRPILVDPRETANVLEMETVNGSVVGISFDTTEVNKLIINPKAFKRMFNLLFLKVYNASWSPDFQSPELWSDYLFLEGYVGDKNAFGQENTEGLMRDLTVLKNYNGIDIKKLELQLSEDMEFPDRLRLVQWEHYPAKSLPHAFCTENLVKLDLRYSQLEKLWDGTQPLANLKEMYVNSSAHLKELPDLSKATNLEILNMFGCSSLVEIPSSVANLRTLKQIKMDYCKSLEIIPTLANLTSLEGHININECPNLRTFPDFPTNQTCFFLKNTGVEELPASLRHCSSLYTLELSGSRNLRTFSTHLPTSLHSLRLRNSDIKSIKSLKYLPNLESLYLSSCKRLELLPEVPSSLQLLLADNCQALKRGSVPLNTPNAQLRFTNCFELDSQTRRAIIQQSYFPNSNGSNWGILPGSELPEEFVHRTTKNSLTIPPSSFNKVKGCILISPELLQDIFLVRSGGEFDHLFFDCEINGNLVREIWIYYKDTIQADHLLIFCSDFLSFDPSKVSTNIVLECRVLSEDDIFSEQEKEEYKDYPLDMIEWGIQILTDEKDLSTTWHSSEVSGKEDDEEGSKSDSGEASKDKDECIADIYESVSRKCSREKTITNAATNLTGQELASQETGQCSSALECSSLTGITEGDDYELVSRKRPRKQ